MSQSLTAHLVVPVANADDAHATARSLREYPHGEVTVVHVVEKTGGAPDKLSLEQAERLAEESFVAFQGVMPDVGANDLLIACSATEAEPGPTDTFGHYKDRTAC
jgi:hypothetical protein